MRRVQCLFILLAMVSSGCGSSFFSARDYLTGPVDGVGLKKSTAIVEGSTEQLFPVVTPSKTPNKNVSWTSSDSTVAAVDANGIVTAIKVGNAVITVTTVEGGFSSSCAVDVKIKPVAVTGVTLNKNVSALLTGKTEQLSAVVSPSNATNQTLVWMSDNAVVAAVGTDGLVTARTAGTANISVLTADGGYKASCKYTVTDTPVSVSGVTLNKSATTIAVGTANAEKLYASIVPTNATDPNCTWSSSDNNIATVDSLGFVTGIAPGSATITVTTADGSYPAVCTCTIVASAVSVDAVTMSPNSVIITAGLTRQLTASVSPSNATNQNLTWSSSNTAVAKVDSSGLVTGVAEGSAAITVTTVDGSKTASCSCVVSALVISVDSVALNKTATSLKIGSAETLYASVSPALASNKGVTWKSSDSSVASVDSSGTVTGKKAGSATITVTTDDGSKTASCVCTIAAASVAVTGVSLLPTLTVSAGSSVPLAATIAPSNATNQNLAWTTSRSSVATVSSGGVVTGVGAGTASITAITEDGSYYDTCAVTVNIDVEIISLSFTTITLGYVGEQTTLTVSFTPLAPTNQNVSWQSLDTTIATVSSSGVVTAVACGTTAVIATSVDGHKTDECVVTVTGQSLKYNANGGTGDLPAFAHYASGTVVTLPGNTGGLTKPCFVFAGWSETTSPGDSGTITSYTVGSDSKTLYAKWNWVTYVTGDIGPAGGIIFYVNPSANYDGWKYLEDSGVSQAGINSDNVSPLPLSLSGVEWSSNTTDTISTSTSIGTGLANTDAIIANDGGSSAARLARSYRGGGYSDWFLPSQYELWKLLTYCASYATRATTGLWWDCWSSSDNGAGSVYYIYIAGIGPESFSLGDTYTKASKHEGVVRAIRRF